MKFNVIVCCQGQTWNYYYKSLIVALLKYFYEHMKCRKFGTMNIMLKQVWE